MLEWFILCLLIVMASVLIISYREVYIYLCMVLGSLLEDIKNLFNKKWVNIGFFISLTFYKNNDNINNQTTTKD